MRPISRWIPGAEEDDLYRPKDYRPKDKGTRPAIVADRVPSIVNRTGC